MIEFKIGWWCYVSPWLHPYFRFSREGLHLDLQGGLPLLFLQLHQLSQQ